MCVIRSVSNSSTVHGGKTIFFVKIIRRNANNKTENSRLSSISLLCTPISEICEIFWARVSTRPCVFGFFDIVKRNKSLVVTTHAKLTRLFRRSLVVPNSPSPVSPFWFSGTRHTTATHGCAYEIRSHVSTGRPSSYKTAYENMLVIFVFVYARVCMPLLMADTGGSVVWTAINHTVLWEKRVFF